MNKLRSLFFRATTVDDGDKKEQKNRPYSDDKNDGVPPQRSSFLRRKLTKTFSLRSKTCRRKRHSETAQDVRLTAAPTSFFTAKSTSTSLYKSRRGVRRSKSHIRPLEHASCTTGSTSSATHYEDVDDLASLNDRRMSAIVVTPTIRSSKSIGEELRSLAQYGWYWGPISRTETQNRLASAADGSFLIRDSCSDYCLLTLSYRCNGQTFHTRTAFASGFYSLFPSSDSSDLFPSVVELIKNAVEKSQKGVLCYVHHGHEMMAVRLLTPVSRFDHVRSLQSLCRFVVRQNIRWDYIDKLPIPPPLKAYLEQNHFF